MRTIRVLNDTRYRDGETVKAGTEGQVRAANGGTLMVRMPDGKTRMLLPGSYEEVSR
jgi:hypothetical protein